MAKSALLAAAAMIALSATALAETPQGAAALLDAHLDRMPDIGPGLAVVVVDANQILLDRRTGTRRVSSGAPIESDTPIYIASQTKAYMGLVAARLHEEGVLSLDSRLTDHWPDLQFPDGVDPSAYTLRDLLSHEVAISNDMITTLEAYVTTVDPADYPALIAEFSEAREPGFEYANLGYNIYGAILETATGKSWQDWLDDALFDPMGWDHTSARTSDFSLDELAWSHIWTGEDGGWHEVRPKTDGMMQSAGGLVTSTADMAEFLQLQLRGEGPAGSGITASMMDMAQTSYAETGQEDRRNPYELSCSGYTLGWSLCEFAGYDIHIHGGGYTGNRTMMAFAPELGVGIAGFSNSDNQTGWAVSRAVINMFFMYLVEDEDADRMSELRVNHYPERVARVLEIRREREAEARADESWGDWSWQPDADTLAEYAGEWSGGNQYLQVRLVLEDAGLQLHWGDARMSLEPAREDMFAGTSHPFDSLDAVAFNRGADGQLVSFSWGGQTYTRHH